MIPHRELMFPMHTVILLLVALAGGAVSVLTPCVLPLLPSILAFSTGEGRRRVWGIVAGIEVSFIGISLLLGATLSALGLPSRTQEFVAATVLVSFGLVLLVPPLEHLFQRLMSRAVSMLPQGASAAGGDGFAAGFLGGATLGLVWAPCAGPILAGITVAANTRGFDRITIAMTLAYGVGMFFPLAAVIFGGRKAGLWLRDKLGGGRRLLAPMGVLLIVTGAVIGGGQLTKVTREIAENINLTSTPLAGIEQRALSNMDDADDSGGDGAPSAAELEAEGYPSSDDGQLHQLGPAPDFAGVNRWHNTDDGKALVLEDLRGKVVLVDFWTYSCINCLRTLPYIRTWHDRYAADGLVIVGVHTPEFEFEKNEDNVARAIKDLDIEYPVATDPGYGTWEQFHNRYWPAKYLIDRDGNIRFVHYGEGEYATTEQRIRDLLALEPMDEHEMQELESGSAMSFHQRTPETYLGYDRASGEQYRSTVAGEPARNLAADRPATYEAPGRLGRHEYALVGRWNVQGERATVAADQAELRLHYVAQDVFLVIGPPDSGGSGTVRVDDPNGTATELEIDGYRLYTLRKGRGPASATMRITASKGVSVYAFTFG